MLHRIATDCLLCPRARSLPDRGSEKGALFYPSNSVKVRFSTASSHGLGMLQGPLEKLSYR